MVKPRCHYFDHSSIHMCGNHNMSRSRNMKSAMTH